MNEVNANVLEMHEHNDGKCELLVEFDNGSQAHIPISKELSKSGFGSSGVITLPLSEEAVIVDEVPVTELMKPSKETLAEMNKLEESKKTK